MTGRLYSAEEIARVCHAANAALQYVQGDPAPSQPWDSLDTAIQAGILGGVRLALEPTTRPRDLHEQWCAARRALGWSWGPVKDSVTRTHPHLVPWAELQSGARDKCGLFLAIVSALGTAP